MASRQISFSLRKYFIFLTFFLTFFLSFFLSFFFQDLHSGLPPNRGLEACVRAHDASGKMRCFGFHGTPCPRSGSSSGTEGATLLVSLDPWFRANVAHNITWSPRDFYIGQENSRPRFGITMMHLCRSYVVKSDFCCLLSCCCLSILETINVLSALPHWTWTWTSHVVICTDISIRSIS